MPVDRQRAGVQALRHKLAAKGDDLIDHLGCDRAWLRMRPARALGEPGLTLGAVSAKEPIQPAAMDAVLRCEFADRAAFAQVCLDQVPPDVHTTTPSPWCRVCPATSVAYPLESDPSWLTPPPPHFVGFPRVSRVRASRSSFLYSQRTANGSG